MQTTAVSTIKIQTYYYVSFLKYWHWELYLFCLPFLGAVWGKVQLTLNFAQGQLTLSPDLVIYISPKFAEEEEKEFMH